MSAGDWHLALEPKVKGTWNLHRSLLSCETKLDFFVMASSITGTIGQATESNYSAANSFLDAFAHHRRSLGLPGTSVALGAIKGVGYLADHPEAEIMLRKQGFQTIDEEDLLLLLDLAISGCQAAPRISGIHDHASVLTGIDENRPVQRIIEDPRAGIMASAASKVSAGGDIIRGTKSNGLPKSIQDALSVSDNKVLYNAAESVVASKLAALVQTPVERITAQTRLADIGMDSMLAVEARQGATLGINVPLVDLMANKATVGDIARKVADGL